MNPEAPEGPLESREVQTGDEGQSDAAQDNEQPQEQEETVVLSGEELAEMLKQAAPSGPMKITRTIIPTPGMKYGKLTELACDVVYTLPEGAPEPMALSFFTPDGTDAVIVVVSPALRAKILKDMSGGVDIATPADLAQEIAKA